MAQRDEYDAIVVGSGPNGMAAAVELARAGKSVLVIEGRDTIGGGTRTLELTLPGFFHDICSAVHPLGVASPFFRGLPLDKHGLEWVYPRYGLAHPFDDGSAAVLDRSIEATGESLGKDAAAYRKLMKPFVENWEDLLEDILGPFPLPPRHPLLMALFGISGLRSTQGLVHSRFTEGRARAFLAGISAHVILPLDRPVTASFGLVLGLLGHAVGWPVARGGSQWITRAMASLIQQAGGEIVTGWRVAELGELPRARAVLFDLIPREFIRIANKELPETYKRRLTKFRHGPAVFKVDWALSEPVPWTAPECREAGTVHLGGSYEEIACSEQLAWDGQHAERPFVLFVQPSVFDPTRAPKDGHTAWAYCHVPAGSDVNMLERIEAQVERFAPGFRDCILERSVLFPNDLEAYNPNYAGGDITGGVQSLDQLFTRPTWDLVPYRTPVESLYLCSSSTPPGGGVHGMCGFHAARAALKRSFKNSSPKPR